MHHFTSNAIVEEEIFILRNLDRDSDRIGRSYRDSGRLFGAHHKCDLQGEMINYLSYIFLTLRWI